MTSEALCVPNKTGDLNVYVSVKNVMYEKKILFRILLYLVAKMENI